MKKRQKNTNLLIVLIILLILLTIICVLIFNNWRKEQTLTELAQISADQQENFSKNFVSSSSSSLSSSSSSSKPVVLVDRAGQQITQVVKEAGFDMGFLYSQQLRELKIEPPLKVDWEKQTSPLKNEETPPQKSLDEIIKRPEKLEEKEVEPITALEKKNLLVMPDSGIEAPIQHLSFDEMFLRKADGNIDFKNQPNYPLDRAVCQNAAYADTCHPVQKKLELGVVHVPTSPQPGELGNSYIAGHTSNWLFIKSAYNYVFKPIMFKNNVGEVFYIYDMYGRKLKFKVFQALEIDAGNQAEAYKTYSDRRVVTLQGSVLKCTDGRPTSYCAPAYWTPSHRWLTRAELMVEG